MNGKPWTERELEMLDILYPELPTEAVAWALGRSVCSVNGAVCKLGLHKSAAYMASPEPYALRRDPSIGAPFRFRPGHVSANKGLRRPGYAPGRMAETQFKPGILNGTAKLLYRPVGTILTDHEGYRRIKIRERTKGDPQGWSPAVWPLLHWQVWEQHHGPIPAGHKIVFRDGNRAHCEIDNLELITDAELMRRNSVHNLPAELQQVIQLNGALKRQIRRRSNAKQNDGPSQPSIRHAGSAAG